MATTLPRPSRPQTTPAIPPPPTSSPSISKTRKSLGSGLPSPSAGLAGSRQSSIADLRSKGLTHTLSTTNLPLAAGKNGSTDSVNSLKTLRRTVSIAAFPQPPRTPGSRIASLQGSPLALIGPHSASSTTPSKLARRGSADDSGIASAKKKKSRSSLASQHTSIGSTPSLLNGSGDSKSVTSSAGQRVSDGLLSIPSPPQSRSSSAQGSYSTSATTNDDLDGLRADSTDDSDSGVPETSVEKGNVIVSVRVKPDAASSTDRQSEWEIDGRKSNITYNGKDGGNYDYDNVFTAKDDNSRVYERCAKRLVRRTMEGFHSTIFAYGMTSSGKTYSMSGTMSSPGLIPLAITDIFGFIRSTPAREFLLRVSYLEIYNEKIYDLLAASDGSSLTGEKEEIKLREDSKRGVYATPLKEEIVQSPTQLLRVIARGDQARRTGSTQFNARSSRSHAVVQIVVESRDRIAGALSLEDGRRKLAATPGGVRVSTLSLIDLAGSERAAENKERRQEGAHINRSLLTLGTIISKLSGKRDKDGNPMDKDGKHLPYRDSKLTRLLQGALSGNSLVSILCTVATGANAAGTVNTAETLNTLKFGARARNNIVSHAKRAEESLGAGGTDGSRVLLERYRMEILTLRNELENTKREKTDKVEDESKEKEKEIEESRHGEQLLEMQLARTALKERIEHLNRLILCSQSTGVNTRSGSVISMHPRLSGQMSSLSMRSSTTQSTMRISNASTIGPLPNAGFPAEEDEEDMHGEFGDGQASLAQQVRALQADLTDKNRYISTLEKRLLHARRSSYSRTSAGFSPTSKVSSLDEAGFAAALRERDAEIAELRARLDDKERMVSALRSAARKREVADLASESQQSSKQGSRRTSAAPVAATATPVATTPTAATPAVLRPFTGRKRTKSVDEMSRMLDEMINDRVQSGELVKTQRGSVRLAGGEKRLSPIDLDSLKPPSAPPTMALPLPPPQQVLAQKSPVLV